MSTTNNKYMKTLNNETSRVLNAELFQNLYESMKIEGDFSQEGVFVQSQSGKTVLEIEFNPDAENTIELYRLDAAFELDLTPLQSRLIIAEATRLYNWELSEEEQNELRYEHPSLTQCA